MKPLRPLIALALVLPLLGGALVAHAQPDGPMFDGGGPMFDDGPDGFRPPPPGGFGGRGPRGGKGRLEGTLRDLKRFQSEDKSLSKAQAVKVVALISPWSKKPTMSDTEAQKLVQGLEGVLSKAQKSKLGPPRRGQGGPPPRGDFGPPPPGDGQGGPPPGGDFGPPGGPPPQGNGGKRPELPASFNPFFAPTGRSDWKKLPYTTQQILARRYRENRAVFESLSKFAKG